MAEKDTSLREDLEAAINADGDADEENTVEIESAAETETATEEIETEAEVSGEAGEEPEHPAALDPEPQPGAVAAPIDWPDEVKAQWDKLDPPVREAIAKRERHVNDMLQQSSEARQAVESFQQMVAPYTPLMQAEGVSDPLVAVNGLLQTTAALAMGSQQQKAQKIAALINHYGVDISTLDSILAGEPAPKGPASDPRIDAIWNRLQQAEQQSQQQTQAETQQTIQQFAADPKNRHFDTVRGVMADLIDVAAANGQSLSIEQAYDRACMAVPEVAEQVIAQRTRGLASAQQQTVAAKRNAASSVHGTRAGADTAGIEDGLSLRETLEAAANLHSSRRI